MNAYLLKELVFWDAITRLPEKEQRNIRKYIVAKRCLLCKNKLAHDDMYICSSCEQQIVAYDER